MSKKTVLVLNAGLEPLHHVTPQKAITMMMRGKALAHESDPSRTFGPYNFPVQLILKKYVPMKWYWDTPLTWSKTGVLRRDNRKCAYCGSSAATIDHVHPVSRGGGSTWENTVAACFKCNNKKGDKSLEELGWTLKFKPGLPRRDELIRNGHTR